MSAVVEEMRSDISKVYLNSSWKKKVARMPDNQVMAIYYSFLAKGKFGHVPKPRRSRQEVLTDYVASQDARRNNILKEPVAEPEKQFKADQAQQLAFDL